MGLYKNNRKIKKKIRPYTKNIIKLIENSLSEGINVLI